MTNSEEIIHHLISDNSKERKDALVKISLFANKGSPEISLSSKVEIISHFHILSHSDFYKICKKLINSKESELIKATVDQIEHHLHRNHRVDFLQLLLEKGRLKPYAFQLVKNWKSRHYGDILVPLIKTETEKNLIHIVHALGEIAMPAYRSRILPLIEHDNLKLRKVVAIEVNSKGGDNIPVSFIQKCLNDESTEIQLAALTGIRKQVGEQWIKPLSSFILKTKNEEVCTEALRLMGNINSSKTMDPLIQFLFQTQTLSLRWACFQALDELDQNIRIRYYKKLLTTVEDTLRPQVFELLGNCEGKETYLALKEALATYNDPASKALIAGAMGTCGYPECEKDLLELMSQGPVEAYGAASALKNLAKSKVMDHFEDFLEKKDLDVLVKQIILQHIGEAAKSMSVPDSLRKRVQSFLKHENDNLRYLSLTCLKSIASVKSIPSLLKIIHEPWLAMFKRDWQLGIEACCNGFLNPLLKVMRKLDPETKELAIEFIKEKPLILSEKDLTLLNTDEAFNNWTWDEDLLHCIETSHKYDKSLIWRMFCDKDLSEKMCCFVARGFDMSEPHIQELLDPIILVQCFSRFHEEKPLLLLAKLMSNFPCVELLPPLIQYAENAHEETKPLFRSFIRKMILNMQAPEN